MRQVGQTFGELQLALHFGVQYLKVCYGRPQPEPAKSEGGRQPDQARRLGLALAQARLQLLEVLQQLLCPLKQGFGLGSRADAPGAALEQAQAQP